MTSAPRFVEELVPTADGTQLALRRYSGTGHLIVALHGFTGNGATMAELVERSRGDRPALLVDLIGHGKSDSPAHPESYSMASVVDQVLSIIGPHQPGTVHLLGYSMGGRIALSMAARAPWYFGSVTTISSSPGIADPVERQERQRSDLALADHLDEIGLDAFVDEWLALDLFVPYRASLDDAAFTSTRQQRLTNSVLGLASSLRGTGTGSMPPLWTALRSIRTPLLAIAGSLDAKYVAIAKAVAETAHDGRSAIVEGVGHVTHVENCHAVAAQVAEFLKVCESDGHLSG